MDKKLPRSIPEIWGGIECSFNRVGERYMDQLEYTGHYQRGESDITRFATLGVKALRYPILWERHHSKNFEIDWSFARRQLNALRERNIEPIVGLLHHGNGPSFTHLLDPSFPEKFAAYAERFAKEFPWITWYTPINEPLTTARFCGLYGIWFPHKRRDKAFATILLNQVKGIVMAMKAIRQVNPHAKLLQTEDLCKTYSTALLQYQADFENERRWLTFDLLSGRWNETHALWEFFHAQRIDSKLLTYCSENFCPPDLIGADHYLTSERYLDQKIIQYPHHTHGGNHHHRYADVEAIRVRHQHPFGLELLLKECWQRYQIPIAVTEVHLNGSTDDQIRWFHHVWKIARRLSGDGIPVRAVTAWALLGSYGWNHLLTQPHGHYEVGCFDVSGSELRDTALVQFLHDLSKDPDHHIPLLDTPGWWETPARCLYNLPEQCREEIPEDRAMIDLARVNALKQTGT